MTCTGRVVGDRLPPVVPDAAVTEHLEVLRGLARRDVRLVERCSEAHAIEVRRFVGQESEQLEHGGGDVIDVAELMTQRARLGLVGE